MSRLLVRSRSVLLLVSVPIALGACRSNEPRTGDIPRLDSEAAQVSHQLYVPGEPANRKWVTCSDGHYDLRDISLDLPQPVPLEFPGAPTKTDLCGVDVSTRTKAFFVAPLAPDAIVTHYTTKLPSRGCSVQEGTPTPEWIRVLTFQCPSGKGTLQISATAGAFQVVMDALPKNTPPAPQEATDS